jgi:hypothetical protein
VLAHEVGDEFVEDFYQAEKGEIDPSVLVVEGSTSNGHTKLRANY